MIRRFLIKILINAAALWVASALLSGFWVSGGLKGYLIAGLVLALLNTLVRPLIKLLALPLILLTLGLFDFIINALILWVAADVSGTVAISGIGTLVWATVIISAVHLVLDHIL
jgi:putative membrane protein